MVAFYTDVTSALPGEVVCLHISGPEGHGDLEVARIGLNRTIVLQAGVSYKQHQTPDEADRIGCDWPVAAKFTIGNEWPSGYYEIAINTHDGESWKHFVCVRQGQLATRKRAVIVLNSNTYQAYNWWGGRSTYCDVAAFMAGRLKFFDALEGRLGVVSRNRPFAQGILAMPAGAPRMMNNGTRGFRQVPELPSRAFNAAHGLGPLDGPAGFLNKWEHAFVSWAEMIGLDLAYLTDLDLDQDPAALEGYGTVVLAGHSEYWSGPQRDALDDFVDNGGKLAIFSGNTSYWKVRWEASGQMICHKHDGFSVEPNSGKDGTHLWSHPNFGRPEAALTGLSFIFGGYHRLGMCVARGAGGYTVYDEDHWALQGADLFYGDLISANIPLLAYENDGCMLQFGRNGELRSVPNLGVPENLEIIAAAPASLGEDPGRGYGPILAPEDMRSTAEIVFGDGSEASCRRLLRGHAVMASLKRGKGEVFNGGTTEWAYALRAGDPYIERITRNVLTRFGAL